MMDRKMAEHMIKQGAQGFHRGSRMDGGVAFERQDRIDAYTAGWKEAQRLHIAQMDVMAPMVLGEVSEPAHG